MEESSMNIFYCKHCKRIVCIPIMVGGTLTCCGDEMTLLQPKMKDLGNEKHLPVVERIAPDQIKVTVGSVLAPNDAGTLDSMALSSTQGDRYQIKTFEPLATTPTAAFFGSIRINLFKVYEFCNLHGLWLSE
ncbi:MAG: hypothetical protein MZU97_16385 [Bacillus subtilis]|nr:hypothetical protein [Bacillus subtilis]